MEDQDIKRKLATILVADIVGYSRLTAHDEDWTIRALGDFRNIVDEIIQSHDGRIFSTGGDSVLAEFASPVEAVRAAVDFQEASRSRNLLQPRERQLRYRIGINLGDVMVRGNDLLGDGVNVAARLEGIAEPGGICVSGTVWDHINGKLSIGYVDIGEQSVKNIPRPVRAYHLRVDGTVGDATDAVQAGSAARTPRSALRLPLAAVIAGGAAIVVVAGGVLAWQLWPKSTPPAPVAAVTAPAATPAPPPATPTPAPKPPATAAQPAATPPAPAAAPQPAPAQTATNAAPPQTFRDCANCPEMVVIPAGAFQMGAPPGENERFNVSINEANRVQPQHPVTFAKAFALAKFDVTRAEFAAFVSATNFHPQPGCMTFANGVWEPQPQASWDNPGFAQTDREPVVCMNQIEIGSYLGWLRRMTGKNYRLPTEAEWEYAARGGTTTAYYWGNDPKDSCAYENVGDQSYGEKYNVSGVIACRDGFSDLAPVGSFKPNPFGLYDMLGNIFVLTGDCWNDSYAGAPIDGSAWTAGDCTKIAARKAGFGNIRASVFRAANREPEGTIVKRNRFGFRVALSLP
ncbi:MAG TPA: SUMF1/EgtB/PvdO family nonheme iron enzyme [Stellaceae bacterium]|nr:SUMF1/EgtB/PvdO family nonheme iron enzyme [Stellaceae bacterium]